MYLSSPAQYKLTHRSSGKFYIGSTRDLRMRLNTHRSNLNRGVHPNHHFQKDYSTWSNIDVTVSYCNTVEQAIELEQTMLNRFHNTSLCCNLDSKTCLKSTTGGGWKLSDEAKEKHRVASTGKTHSEETKALLLSKRLGIFKHTQETKDEMSRTRKGLKHNLSDEERDRRRTAVSVMHTEEVRKKISLAHMGKVLSDEHKAKLRSIGVASGRKVSAEGVIYPTTAAVARAHGIDHRTVRGRIDSKTERFVKWFYID